MGASFIHGIGPGVDGLSDWDDTYNPVYELVNDNNIQTSFAFESIEDLRENFIWYDRRE